MKPSETYVLTTRSEQELEIPPRSRVRSYFSKKVVPRSSPTMRRAHRGRFAILSMIAVITILLAGGLSPMMAASQMERGPKTPDFFLLANDGQTYTPDYLKGNVVLLMFWATWCPYCRRAMPHMNELAREYANAPFTLLGICGSKDPNAWRNYIEQHQLRWPQYLDRNLKMAHLFHTRGVPNFFLIDKDGYIVAHWVGWDNSMAPGVEKLIDRTLDEPGQ